MAAASPDRTLPMSERTHRDLAARPDPAPTVCWLDGEPMRRDPERR
ncbi:hypothetical protein [Alloactinosynnema sp. L-07]|nr:hypothetical protein [Alloactinosynnema sp. L-07]